MKQVKIKLMTDYNCWPLWWADNDKSGNIDPATLPLLDDTVKRLSMWAEAYNAQLNIDDPASSTALSGNVLDVFEQEGQSLWRQLRKEFEGKFKVYYYSTKLERLLEDPDDMP